MTVQNHSAKCGIREALSQNEKQMAKFSFTMTIEASSEQEAEKKVNALGVLASKLKTIEVEKLAHIVKNDPAKTALAKAYLGLQ